MLFMMAMNLGLLSSIFGNAGDPSVGHSEYSGPVSTDEYTFTETITIPPFTHTAPADTTTDDPYNRLAPLFGLLGGLISGSGDTFSNSTTLFTVESDTAGEIYLKMQSYGDYNGKGWETAPEYDELLYGKYSADYLRGFTTDFEGVSKLKIKQALQKDPYSSSNPYTYYHLAPYYLRYTDDESIAIQKSDVSVYIPFESLNVLKGENPASYSYMLLYSPESGVQNVRSEAVGAYELAYREFVYENYLEIDEQTLSELRIYAEKQGLDPSDPQIIDKVADIIKSSAKYNIKYDRGLDDQSNIVLSFLYEYREGVCSHFAAAATMLYRSLGIPARYTVGFLTDTDGVDSVGVKAKDAHAWVEVYEDGIGWRRVEVTGSSSTVLGCPGANADHTQHNCSSYIVIGKIEPTPESYGFTIFECFYCGSVFHGDYTDFWGYTEITTWVEPDTDPDYPVTTPDITTTEDPSETTEPVYIPSGFTIKPRDVERVYDGTPLTATEIEGFPQELLDLGYTYSFTLSGSQTEIGKAPSRISSFIIYSPSGKDVTDLFDIYKNVGVIRITRGVLIFESNSLTATYPKSISLTTYNIRIVSAPEGFDASNYTIQYNIDATAYRDIGTYTATFSVTTIYNNVTGLHETDEYTIVCRYGKLTIEPARLVIQTGSAEKVYDGKPLTDHSYTIIEGELHSECILQCDYYAQQLAIGSCDNIFGNVRIVNSSGKDISYLYRIEVIPGTLTVLPPS